MPWFRIDDGAHCHPKVIEAGNAAIGLLWRLGAYCADHLTDGSVPTSIVTAYGTRAEISKLLRLGMLYRDGNVYIVRDYLEWNMSAEQVRAIREATATRQQKWRETRASNAVSNGVSNAVTNSAHTTPYHKEKELLTDIQQPPYVQPVPDPVENSTRTTTGRGDQ